MSTNRQILIEVNPNVIFKNSHTSNRLFRLTVPENAAIVDVKNQILEILEIPDFLVNLAMNPEDEITKIMVVRASTKYGMAFSQREMDILNNIRAELLFRPYLFSHLSGYSRQKIEEELLKAILEFKSKFIDSVDGHEYSIKFIENEDSFYRYHDSRNAGNKYLWLSSNLFKSEEEARQSLAIKKEWNDMNSIDCVHVKEGAWLIVSRSSGMDELEGGAEQYFFPADHSFNKDRFKITTLTNQATFMTVQEDETQTVSTSSAVARIEIDTGPFTNNYIHVHFKENASSKALSCILEELKRIADVIVKDVCVYSLPVSAARRTLNALRGMGQISTTYRNNLERLLVKSENMLVGLQLQISSHDHQLCLKQYIGDMVDFILSLSDDHQKALMLFKYIFSKDFNYTYRQNSISDLLNSINVAENNNEEQYTEVMKSISELAAIARGKNDISDIFRYVGLGALKQHALRRGMVEILLEHFFNHFKSLPIENKFLYSAEMHMMVSTMQSNIYPESTESYLRQILAGKVDNRTLFFTFVDLGGYPSVISRAVKSANLTQDQIYKLSVKFKSDMIAELAQDHMISNSVNCLRP